jgi:hypothetical protein
MEENEVINAMLTLEFKPDLIAMEKNIEEFPESIQKFLYSALTELTETKYLSCVVAFKHKKGKLGMEIMQMEIVDAESYTEQLQKYPDLLNLDEIKCMLCEQKDTCTHAHVSQEKSDQQLEREQQIYEEMQKVMKTKDITNFLKIDKSIN